MPRREREREVVAIEEEGSTFGLCLAISSSCGFFFFF